MPPSLPISNIDNLQVPKYWKFCAKLMLREASGRHGVASTNSHQILHVNRCRYASPACIFHIREQWPCTVHMKCMCFFCQGWSGSLEMNVCASCFVSQHINRKQINCTWVNWWESTAWKSLFSCEHDKTADQSIPYSFFSQHDKKWNYLNLSSTPEEERKHWHCDGGKEKIQAVQLGIEPRDSRFAHECSNHWAIAPHIYQYINTCTSRYTYINTCTSRYTYINTCL